MSHWLLDVIADKRTRALKEAARAQLFGRMTQEAPALNTELLLEVVAALELAVLDLDAERLGPDDERLAFLHKAATDAFRLMRVSALPDAQMAAATQLLRASALAVIGNHGAEAAQWLRTLEVEQGWPNLPLNSDNWGERCRATLADIWLRLMCGKDGDDRDVILARVSTLRAEQQELEQNYLASLGGVEAKRSALELIAIYHLTKAADVLAHFITGGVEEDSYQVQSVLDLHFDGAIAACDTGNLLELGPLTCLLARAATQMVEGC
ncbi:hypothetical protein ACFOY8_12400 [Thalassospira xianhensis]|uniref:Uncharacterized protein n=1 Tax=Thalassospira xianhensis MCCC 1A02616 TaxID=1177929 RepID=A0A367UDE5_9PROT|nr:hypothetical protein [Thalassospira xianhensis]RCK06335.1 hypothetical protein TH5_09035 [Thalassospira xianhensis MCCC 1A02616]